MTHLIRLVLFPDTMRKMVELAHLTRSGRRDYVSSGVELKIYKESDFELENS